MSTPGTENESSRGPAPIATRNLTKDYCDFWGRPRVRALDSLTLELRPGEVFGLLGPNGSGKTTAIKLALGLLHPTSGQVYLWDTPPSDVSVRARVGFLPEESYFHRFLSAEETLDYHGKLFDLPRDVRRKRADELIRMVGLDAARRRLIGEYSKGMARRIGLAQALIADPDLVILDEPTSGLDPTGSREVKDLILRLRQRGKTVLLCSHLLAEVEDVCDRIAILYRGRLICVGAVDELLTRSNETCFQAVGLTAEAREEIEAAIRERGGNEVRVTTPRERLESFFLKTVSSPQEVEKKAGGGSSGEAAK